MGNIKIFLGHVLPRVTYTKIFHSVVHKNITPNFLICNSEVCVCVVVSLGTKNTYVANILVVKLYILRTSHASLNT